MGKLPSLGVRIDPAVKSALEAAAKADSRSLSSLVQKILSEWVKDNSQSSRKIRSRQQ
jgi:predicted HicB family RNase H-like nuclease